MKEITIMQVGLGFGGMIINFYLTGNVLTGGLLGVIAGLVFALLWTAFKKPQ